MIRLIALPLLLLPSLLPPPSLCYTWPSIESERPEDCARKGEAFDSIALRCVDCSDAAEPTRDGLGCRCKDGFRVLQDTGNYGVDKDGSRPGQAKSVGSLLCERCPRGQAPTRERDRCIKCPEGRKECRCGEDEVRVEREPEGRPLLAARCVRCSPGHSPSADGTRCVPCHLPPLLKDRPNRCNCSSAAGAAAGVCLPNNLGMDGLYTPSASDEVVKFGGLSSEVRSALFKGHVSAAAYLCHVQTNATACQMLGNLCALALHDKSQAACEILFDLTRRQGVRHLPQLYFPDRMSTSIGSEEEITNVYNVRGKNSRLNITAAKYSLRGQLLSLSPVDGLLFQMCNGSFSELDAAFDFATRYRRGCRVQIRQLLKRGEPEFYDLYVPYRVAGKEGKSETKLYAVPVLIENMPNNKARDDSKWTFTSRIFLVDAVTGVPVSAASKKGKEGQGEPGGGGDRPKVIRYLKRMDIRVQMINTRENPEKAGRMYPPVVAVEYGETSYDKLESGEEVDFDFSFSVSYMMDLKEGKKDIEISVGVMSVFAVLYAAMQTWSWSRRSGRVAVDPATVAKLVINTCGSLAHVFLAVMFFTSLYWFAFFKEQSYLHVILPTPDQEKKIKHYLIVIFVLKVIDIIHLIVTQVTVDIFLVDWERPHAVSPVATATAGGGGGGGGGGGEPTKELAVSVWRTYLVANEWNELQTRRKTSTAVQILVVVFILKVCGVEHLATADPLSSLTLDDGLYHAEPSFVCRFALGCAVYLAVAVFQAVFWGGFWNGCIEDKLEQFTDVCSMANISVFVMANGNFGYYIHGRSAHGFADTDMATLLEQLQREADDFSAHRGLTPGSDDQTFVMSLPLKLRSFYDKIVAPASEMSGVRGGPRNVQYHLLLLVYFDRTQANGKRFRRSLSLSGICLCLEYRQVPC